MGQPDIIGNISGFDVLKEKMSHVTSGISSLNVARKGELEFSDIVEILNAEMASFNVMFSVEATKKQHLLDEDERLSKYIKEEEDFIAFILKYLENNPNEKDNESLMDQRKEFYFKLETMHRKIISLLKKYAKRYFPEPSSNTNSDDLFLSRAYGATKSVEQKSLLDILSVLVLELGLERNCNNNTGILHVDDTIPQEYINMLVCADIAERIPDDPSYVRLK